MVLLEVLAPVAGRVLLLADVPDPVFATGMVGPGAAIDPDLDAGDAVAPVAGRLTTVHPHAFVVQPLDAPAVMVHLGIDTVQLRGAGFRLHRQPGDDVLAGQPVIGWDPADVAAGGRSPLCPVLALDAEPDQVAVAVRPGDQLSAGELLFTWSG